MKLKLENKNTTAAFKAILKLAKIRRGTKKQMISLESNGDQVYLSLGGVAQEINGAIASGCGSIYLPLEMFQSLVETMSADGFTIDCDGSTAKVLQGKSVLTLPENVFRDQFSEALIKKQKKNEKDFQRAKKQLVENMDGADQIVYLDESNQMRSGILIKKFQSNGKEMLLIADENRNVREIFASQAVHTQRADVPLNDMWKAKIIIPLKFDK